MIPAVIPLHLPSEETRHSWAAGVSGGADSVAMLLLCRDFVAHVVTVDHETRLAESAADAAFVANLAEKLGLPCTILRRSDLEREIGESQDASQAWFRRLRARGFADVVAQQGLAGVLLAHQADDVAETVAIRLNRGSSILGLRGIAANREVGGVRVWRPVLQATGEQLRNYLRSQDQPWREDRTNAMPDYGRNRIRHAMTPELAAALRELAGASDTYLAALETTVGPVDEPVGTGDFDDTPLGRMRARIYLQARVPPGELSSGLVERFVAWSSDAAGRAFNLPGGRVLRRRKGQIN